MTESFSQAMDTSSTKSSQKLLHKFAPFRKRQLKQTRSTNALAEDLPSVDEIAISLQSPGSESESLSNIDLAQTPMQVTFSDQRWGTREGLSYSALPTRKELPTYTPMPVPERISSANREAAIYDHRTAREPDARDRNVRTKTPIEPDSVSLGSALAFDDDLLRPRTPISPLPLPPGKLGYLAHGESPVLGRLSSNGSQKAPSQYAEQPRGRTRPSKTNVNQSHATQSDEPQRGRSRPPTPADSTGKSSVSDRFPQPPETRLLSPPESTSSHSLHAPSKLGPEALAQLQVPSADKSDVLETELIDEDDPDNWDIINRNARTADDWDRQLYSLERRAEQLYSSEHLHTILEDKDFHFRFATFLRRYRPWRLPILAYYWDTCKAIKALTYANSLTQVLSKRPNELGEGTAIHPPGLAANGPLHDAAQQAFMELLGDDLHWYIASTYIGIVRTVMQSRVTGNLPAPLREASHGLAEVFCITDPTRRDNPIILASPAFTRHSGCNMDYILGRNCRFMQGPGTTVDSCKRFAISMEHGRDHSEIFVNYRRDGSPFLSLVMNAQLLDSRGNIRYYLGAQVDVSGLLKNCSGLDSLTKLVEQQKPRGLEASEEEKLQPTTAIKALSEMLNGEELDIINKNGGILQRGYEHELQSRKPSDEGRGGPARVLLAEASDDSEPEETTSNNAGASTTSTTTTTNEPESPLTELNLSGVYSHYLLIRPAPSLRILFASPTLRQPGTLQSHFLHRIGGTKMRQDLDGAFQEAKVVTARVRWLKSLSEDGDGEGSTRWLHCTPLMHHTGRVGLWMIVVVMPSKEDEAGGGESKKTSIRSGGGSRMGYSRMNSDVSGTTNANNARTERSTMKMTSRYGSQR